MHYKKYGFILLLSGVVISLQGMEDDNTLLMEEDTSQKRQVRDQETLNLLNKTIPASSTFQEVEKSYRAHFGGGEIDYSSAMIQFLLSDPANNDLFEELVNKDGFDPEKCTIALREAATDQDVYAVNELLKKGVPISQKDEVMDRTILIWALARSLTPESYVIAHMILNHPDGAQLIDDKDILGQTPLLSVAVCAEAYEQVVPFIDLLIGHAANPNISCIFHQHWPKEQKNSFEALQPIDDGEAIQKYMKEKRQEYLRKIIKQNLLVLSNITDENGNLVLPVEMVKEIVFHQLLPNEIDEMK